MVPWGERKKGSLEFFNFLYYNIRTSQIHSYRFHTRISDRRACITMVLWEIALGTAYFLGLKRTYRLVLRTQRRLVTPNSPRIRQFLHRKTRTIFDATLKAHRAVQQRDIEVGRNLGNWILRWLDKTKPADNIRVGSSSPTLAQYARIPNKQLTDSYHQIKSYGRELCSRRLVNSSRNLWLTAYPTVAKLLRRREPVMNNIHYRQLVSGTNSFDFRVGFGFNGVIRNDIMQFLSHG